jgi:Zn-dependent M16 (insulinase) family peptidase
LILVLNPSLTQTQFETEVHHLDGDAKIQGVVYCEMAARENTESDLLDLNLRRMVYSKYPFYSSECGFIYLILRRTY